MLWASIIIEYKDNAGKFIIEMFNFEPATAISFSSGLIDVTSEIVTLCKFTQLFTIVTESLIFQTANTLS